MNGGAAVVWPDEAPFWCLLLLAIGAVAGYWFGVAWTLDGRVTGRLVVEVENYLRRADQ
jgi:hypothetical protein